MCAKYQIWLRHFKDESKNVHWPLFLWTTLYEDKLVVMAIPKICVSLITRFY